jgi:TolB protein
VNTDGTGYFVMPLPDETITLAPDLWLNANEVTFTGWDDSDPSRNGMYVADPAQPASLRRITSSPGLQDQVVAITADGSRIAFVRAAAGETFGPLFTVNADGTNVKQVSPSGVLVSPAGGWGGSTVTWSPDGSQLTFAATQLAFSATRGGCACAVYVVDADGANPRRIFDQSAGEIFGAHWSPDGQWVAFESVPDGSTQRDGPNDQVMLIHPDGSGLKAITSEQMLSGSWSPQWSPDGSRLVFQSSSRDGDHADLWTSNADGSDLAQLTHDPGRYDTYTWGAWSAATP